MKKDYQTPMVKFVILEDVSVIVTSSVETELGGTTDHLDAKSRSNCIWDD